MKIGIDYHGVINRNPSFFSGFSHAAKTKNVTLYIVSGASEKSVKNFLVEHNICYDKIFSLLDYFEAKKMVTYFENGSFFVDNESWNRAKADFCAQNQIDFHIDDSILYGTYFKTPFCLYRSEQKICSVLNRDININFNQAPEKVLEDIINQFEKF